MEGGLPRSSTWNTAVACVTEMSQSCHRCHRGAHGREKKYDISGSWVVRWALWAVTFVGWVGYVWWCAAGRVCGPGGDGARAARIGGSQVSGLGQDDCYEGKWMRVVAGRSLFCLVGLRLSPRLRLVNHPPSPRLPRAGRLRGYLIRLSAGGMKPRRLSPQPLASPSLITTTDSLKTGPAPSDGSRLSPFADRRRQLPAFSPCQPLANDRQSSSGGRGDRRASRAYR